MNPTDMPGGNKDWDGVEQREIRRRHIIERRVSERRKRYWWSIIFPILLGSILTALISWGVYVTHITYRISASYEETFVKHIEREIEKDAALDHKLELMKAEYTTRMDTISSDTRTGLAEIRRIQTAMYQLLLNERRESDKESNH